MPTNAHRSISPVNASTIRKRTGTRRHAPAAERMNTNISLNGSR
jgi:hypothetical protein